MSFESLIKNTGAYRIVAGEKKRDALSHAYLIVCADGERLKDYLKVFAKLIMCENGDDDFCGECRACTLIDRERYTDCSFYPAEGNKILVADVDDLVSQTYIKPLENKRRLFCLCGAENMNAAAQNKLLKTLEEPPQNVVILMGATQSFSLLPTIVSRVKRIEIPPFGEKALFEGLKEECPDGERLKNAIEVGGGKIGATIKAYGGDSAQEVGKLAEKVLYEMTSSKSILYYASKIDKDNISLFITALYRKTGEMLIECEKNGTGEINGFKTGALIAIEDMLCEKQRLLNFNANVQMTIDGILFGILEEKYKWQKL